MFTMGGCFYAAIILLPQRFQAVAGISAMRAGITLLPFTLVSPVCSVVCGVILSRKPPSAEFLLLFGSAVTVVGIVLLGDISTALAVHIPPAVYGYEVILGVGIGFMMTPMLMIVKIQCADADLGKCLAITGPWPRLPETP